MAYYAVCKLRAETHKLPPPRLYCIGLSVGAQYKLGLTLLNDGKDINLTTKTYSILQENDNKEIIVKLNNYNQEEEGTLRIFA